MICKNCIHWDIEIPKIDGPIVFIEETRSYMSFGKVKQFEFCPWCGGELEDTPKEPRIVGGFAALGI